MIRTKSSNKWGNWWTKVNRVAKTFMNVVVII